MAQPSQVEMPRKLWQHPYPLETNMARFMRMVNKTRNMKLQTFQELYQWTIGDVREQFWEDLWGYLKIVHEGQYEQIVEPSPRMDQLPRWYRGVRLNFAENVLFYPSPTSRSHPTPLGGKEDTKVALTEVREGCKEIRHVTWGELRQRVGRMASAMREHGVGKRDRVAVVSSNSVDTLTVFLSVASVGGLFSSSSTDMGTKGVLDRLTQIKPKWLFMDDSALYNGKSIDLRQKMGEIVAGMKGVEEFQGVVSMPRWGRPLEVGSVPKAQLLAKFLSAAKTDVLSFERVEFSDPMFIAYSSGTTGQPKCIVHSTGGIILSGKKEAVLHRDMAPDATVLQYTTTGWIMYLSSVVSLLEGARAILYDGSPFQPDPTAFVRLIGDQKVTKLGVSPKWMQTLVAANIAPRQITDLSNLIGVTSTGMVLPESLFHWFYDVAFPARTQLCNISGGTDIAACFSMENPLTPLYVGGCQGPSLGTAVDVYDSTVEGGPGVKGRRVGVGQPGELVAPKSFPNMPCMFWPGDETAMQKYWDAYFGKFDNVWTHGDYMQIHPNTGQHVYMGRADGVLNPSGVRFGSAEIYSVIEKAFPKTIADSVVVGQRRPGDMDENVILFLKMQPSVPFTPSVVQDVRDAIARERSKRHVPKYIFETPEIPTTVNMKKVELPIKHIVSGRTVKPSGTLLNPQSLDFYCRFVKVEELVGDGRKGSKL